MRTTKRLFITLFEVPVLATSHAIITKQKCRDRSYSEEIQFPDWHVNLLITYDNCVTPIEKKLEKSRIGLQDIEFKR